jgi:hypothetical protein
MVLMANAAVALGIPGMLEISFPAIFEKRAITSEFLTVIL